MTYYEIKSFLGEIRRNVDIRGRKPLQCEVLQDDNQLSGGNIDSASSTHPVTQYFTSPEAHPMVYLLVRPCWCNKTSNTGQGWTLTLKRNVFLYSCGGLQFICAASCSVKAHDKESPVSHTDRMVIASIRFEDIVSGHISVWLFSYLCATLHVFLIN